MATPTGNGTRNCEYKSENVGPLDTKNKEEPAQRKGSTLTESTRRGRLTRDGGGQLRGVWPIRDRGTQGEGVKESTNRPGCYRFC